MNDDTEIQRTKEVQGRTCQCCRLSWKTLPELKEHLTYQAKRIADQLGQLGATAR